MDNYMLKDAASRQRRPGGLIVRGAGGVFQANVHSEKLVAPNVSGSCIQATNL